MDFASGSSASCRWSSLSKRKSCWASASKAAWDKAVLVARPASSYRLGARRAASDTAPQEICFKEGLMSLLEIKDLKVRVDNHDILKGINLTVNPGEVHSIMGPNGSGKSTLAQVLARREAYEVTGGKVLFNGKDLLAMKAEDAACEGIFLAFQYPVEIPGIGNAYFLRSALNA